MPINIVLYQPEIPQNTGNIIRTCIGVDAKLHLIKPLGFDLDKKNVRRSAANYIEEVDMTVYENWDEFLEKNDGTIYFITRYGKKPHSTFDYSNQNENIYFVFGKESAGVPKEILKGDFDKCLRLPMTEKIRSLNLSNCVAIVAYEALRQQDYPNLAKTEPFKGENYIIED